MFNQKITTQPNIKLPIGFFSVALLSFGLSQIHMLYNHFQTPVVWMIAHLFLIGFALFMTMGCNVPTHTTNLPNPNL